MLMEHLPYTKFSFHYFVTMDINNTNFVIMTIRMLATTIIYVMYLIQ